MRKSLPIFLLARCAAVAGLASALLLPSVAAAATTLSTTGIVTDAFTANGNVNFDDASADVILIGQNAATPDTVTIAGDVSLTDSQWGITAAGAGTFATLNGLALTANPDGFSVAGGTTSRTLTVTGGDITLTAAGATNVTLPASGTLATLAGTETLTNKTARGLFVDSATATDDRLHLVVAGGGAARFDGNLTMADLGAARSWSLPDADGNVVIDSASQTLTNKSLTSPSISGGTIASLTSIGLTDGATHSLILTAGSLSANGSLQLSFPLSTSMTLGGNLQTASAFTTLGAFPMTLTATGLTGVTLPTSGTLATLAGTETFTNKTLTAPRISGIKDLNGNDILQFNATAGAVNGFQMFNSGSGLGPTLMVVGTDANADMRIQAKGNGGFLFLNPTPSADMIKIQPQSGGAATFQGTLTSADLTGNRTWTLPDTAGTIALLSDIAASGVTGTGANGGVTFWTGASALSNDAANFFWDDTLKALGIGTNNPTTALAVADNNGAASNASTLLTLTHKTTATAAAGIGAGIMFQAENDAGAAADAGSITATLDTATSGAEDSTLKFATRSAGGALTTQLFVTPTGAYTQGNFAVLGSTSIGDAVGDTMTFNAASASILDHLNFDTGTLQIDAINNRVGMGTSTPQAALHVQTGVTTAMNTGLNPAGASSFIVAHQNGPQIDEFVVAGTTSVHRAILKGVRADGTLGGPTSVVNGDHTFTVEGAAYDGTNVNATAAIDFILDGTISTNVVPQRIAFMTSATNESALAERMTVSPSGFVGVGDTSPAALFTVGSGDPFQIDVNGNVATTGTLTVGSGGTPILKHLSLTQIVSGAVSVPAQSCVTIGGVTVTGAAAGDTVIATPTPIAGGIETLPLSWNAFVSGSNAVSIRACNPTSGSTTTTDQTWRVDVWHH